MTYLESLTYPTKDEEWMKTVLLGGVLLAFGFLLVPALVAYGYLVRAIRGSLAGEDTPPGFGDWKDWKGLLVDGLKVGVVGVVYMIVPVVVAVVTVGGAGLALLTGSEPGAVLGIAGLLGGLALSFLLALVFGYVAVIAIVNVAKENRIGAAFDFGTILGVATDARYALPWLVSVAVFVAVGIVSVVLGLVPVLGQVLTAIVTFYAGIVAADLWGRGFVEATADRPQRETDEHRDVAV